MHSEANAVGRPTDRMKKGNVNHLEDFKGGGGVNKSHGLLAQGKEGEDPKHYPRVAKK